jgi:hypothetical protein
MVDWHENALPGNCEQGCQYRIFEMTIAASVRRSRKSGNDPQRKSRVCDKQLEAGPYQCTPWA